MLSYYLSLHPSSLSIHLPPSLSLSLSLSLHNQPNPIPSPTLSSPLTPKPRNFPTSMCN